MGHVIAAAIYNGLSAFEYGLAREILGRDRTELEPSWYHFRPCRVESGNLYSNHEFEIRPHHGLRALSTAQTILICGWRNPRERPPDDFLAAVRSAHARGTRLVSICTGAFVLAYAGLLDGRTATTHWLYTATLTELFPEVDLEANALYVHDHQGPAPILTSAGSTAGIDLCLAMIRDDFGASTASAVARRMVAPIHRDGGQTQYTDPPSSRTDDRLFSDVLEWMAARLDRQLTIDAVARRFGFSLRTFQRRFKAITGSSPHQWLIRQRVARARELLESTDLNIDLVAEKSGLGSATNLRKHLARELETTPRAYRGSFQSSH